MLTKRYAWAVRVGRVGLVRYLAGASAARLGSEAVALALVLAARANGVASVAIGVLVAAWSAPSVLTGFVVGGILDRAERPGRYITGAAVVAGTALVADAVLMGRLPVGVLVAVTALGGAAVPLLTGGLSSQLPGLVDHDRLARAQGLDAASYNVAGIAGPAMVALLAGIGTPRLTLAVPAVAVVAGALLLPPLHPPATAERVERRPARVRSLVAPLAHTAQLRAATLATTVAAFGWGGLELGAAGIAAALATPNVAGIFLSGLSVVALVASLAAARYGLRRIDGAIPVTLVTMSVGAAIIAVAPTPVIAGLGFALVGAADGILLPATLAVRTRDAPPGLAATVFATGASLKLGASALGAGVAGVVMAGIGVRGLFVALAGSQLLAAGCGRTAGALSRARPRKAAT